MKTVYKFKPFRHCKSASTRLTPLNYITDCQYDILVKFYGEDMLKVEQEEENETN